MRLTILFILSHICLNLLATHQEPDRIYYNNSLVCIGNRNGFEIDGSSYPLSSCTIEMQRPSINKGSSSTANFRGYVATWAIRNDSLFLVKMQNIDFVEVPLKLFFSNKKTFNGIFASWYKGVLRIETNEGVITYDSELKRKSLLLVAIFENGIVKEKFTPNTPETKRTDNTKTKHKSFK